MRGTGDTYPIYDEDLFLAEPLQRPIEHYRRIRDLGPAVKLLHVDALALGRFADVQAALRAPDILISGQGTAFNDAFNKQGPEPELIASDGARHGR